MTVPCLSTINLFHAALIPSDLHVLILRLILTFERLKREALCNGSGLRARQEFRGPFKYLSVYVCDYRGRGGAFGSEALEYNDTRHNDAEIEVRVLNIKCDEVNALPSINFNINVREVCAVASPRFSGDNQEV